MFREDKTIAQPDAYASPTPSLNPAFKLAATHGVLASIRLHIDRKDFLDGRDSYGQTALMIASKKNHAEVCRLLIDAGADRTLVDSNGLTAQDLAAAAGAQNALIGAVKLRALFWRLQALFFWRRVVVDQVGSN